MGERGETDWGERIGISKKETCGLGKGFVFGEDTAVSATKKESHLGQEKGGDCLGGRGIQSRPGTKSERERHELVLLAVWEKIIARRGSWRTKGRSKRENRCSIPSPTEMAWCLGEDIGIFMGRNPEDQRPKKGTTGLGWGGGIVFCQGQYTY